MEWNGGEVSGEKRRGVKWGGVKREKEWRGRGRVDSSWIECSEEDSRIVDGLKIFFLSNICY